MEIVFDIKGHAELKKRIDRLEKATKEFNEAIDDLHDFKIELVKAEPKPG